MNKLIINSDDYGYSRGINHATIDSYQRGILTSTTLMTNTPGFEHAVELAKENKGLGIGVHLVMTFLKPLCDDVPSLVDQKGSFHRQGHYLNGNHQVDSDELYREWDAQIQKVLDAGIQPTHLDSHHHSHIYNESHLEVFFELAKKYNLPARVIAQHGAIAKDTKTTSYFEPSFDEVTSLSHKDSEVYLNNLYEKIKENESTEIMCHVGYLDEFLISSSSFTEPRIYQVNILTKSNFTEKIRSDEKIQLSKFSDL